MKHNSLIGATIATVLCASAAGAHADLIELKWATEGYFRSRAVMLTNLAPQDRYTTIYPVNSQQIVIPEIRNTSYISSRLRIMPTLSYAKVAKLQMQIDALDDVLWGDNNGLSTAPLFATDTSNQNFLGGATADSVQLRRAWVEFDVPVGKMRVGRMPSHWGMGILANGGGSGRIDPTTPIGEAPRAHQDAFFDEDFGDNHFGSTADRILFITKPLQVARTIAKSKNPASNFVMGYAYDKLSEAPLLSAEPFERTFRPFGQQGFISRGSNDDVNEHVALAVYADPDWDQVRYTDQLIVGMYGVLRTQKEGSTQPSVLVPTDFCGTYEGAATPCVDTGSKVWIADLWWKLRYGPYYTEGELVKIGGKTFGGVPFPSKNQLKEADIYSGVVRAGYLTQFWDAVMEVGHASGDDVLEDEHFKQRALHPDFNVGLILFEETLRELSARTYGVPFFSPENPEGATGLFSKGGVINSTYLYPKGRWRPGIAGLEFVGAVLFAWADELATGTGMFRPCSPGGCLADETDSKYLGTEVDVAVKTSFVGKMELSIETGYLRFGKALKSALPNADSSFTLQSRLAFVW